MLTVIAALSTCMCSSDLKKAKSANVKQVKDYVNSPMGRLFVMVLRYLLRRN